MKDPFEPDGEGSESSASADSEFSDAEMAAPGQVAAPRNPDPSEAATADSGGQHPGVPFPTEVVGQIGGPPPDVHDAMKAREKAAFSRCHTAIF